MILTIFIALISIKGSVATSCDLDYDCVDLLNDYFAVCVKNRCFPGRKDGESCLVVRQCHQQYQTCNTATKRCDCAVKRSKKTAKCVNDESYCDDNLDCEKQNQKCLNNKCQQETDNTTPSSKANTWQELVGYIVGGGGGPITIIGVIVYLLKRRRSRMRKRTSSSEESVTNYSLENPGLEMTTRSQPNKKEEPLFDPLKTNGKTGDQDIQSLSKESEPHPTALFTRC